MRRTRIKICGLTTIAGIEAAVEAGVDALGFVFSESPRRLSPRGAAELARAIPRFVSKVAVFFGADGTEIARTLEIFPADLVQTEPVIGLEIRVPLLPVFHDDGDILNHVLDTTEPDGTVLLEAPGRGGRGVSPSWERAASIARRRRLVLAGGLTPDNVADAIAQVRPFAVDVSSGVETEGGVKDAALIRAFVHAVRATDEDRSHQRGGEDVACKC